MSAPATAGPYAVCRDCGVDLPTPEDASAHGEATLAPTGQASPSMRSHGWRVVNPTAEERARSRVASVIDRALDRAFGDLDEEIHRGDVTEEEVTAALRRNYPDLADAWDDWREEDED